MNDPASLKHVETTYVVYATTETDPEKLAGQRAKPGDLLIKMKMRGQK